MTEEDQKENQKSGEEVKKKDNKIVFFAETNFRNQRTRFGIKKDDRRRHMYLIGKTGMGKSTAMENMIIQDIINGEGVALVDPHGDFAEKILDYIPNDRINDVIYLDPSDIEYPVAFNVMESISVKYKHLVASGLIGVFKKLWADSWGPRLEYLLRNAILALLDYPGSTLLGVMRILSDKSYRNKVIKKIQDPVVKAFWVEEYSNYPQKFQAEAIAPIQNKVGQFLSTSLIRNVVGQVTSTINLREIMDNRKILIMNLSKGKVGEDSSALLGAMMITKIQLAAMSRIDILEEDRKDFYLYVDEFQNFATESFANILSEARKYRLDLIIGHQYIEQLEEEVRAAVFGNVGTLMCFRVGAADSEVLAVEFAPYFTEEDLVNLTKFDVYMKLMIDGVASNPFSASTLPPLGENAYTGNKDKVIAVSRERYAKPRNVVEEKINRWSGVMNDDEDEKYKENKNRDNSKKSTGSKTAYSEKAGSNYKNKSDWGKNENKKEKYTVNCYECGKPTEITFKPDGIRPIYCQDCFKKVKKNLMAGEAKSVRMEESANDSQPEISLNDALKQSPASFDQKRGNRPQNRQINKQKSDGAGKPKSTIKELAAKKIKEEQEGSQSQQQPNNGQLKTIRPGEVVKF